MIKTNAIVNPKTGKAHEGIELEQHNKGSFNGFMYALIGVLLSLMLLLLILLVLFSVLDVF